MSGNSSSVRVHREIYTEILLFSGIHWEGGKPASSQSRVCCHNLGCQHSPRACSYTLWTHPQITTIAGTVNSTLLIRGTRYMGQKGAHMNSRAPQTKKGQCIDMLTWKNVRTGVRLRSIQVTRASRNIVGFGARCRRSTWILRALTRRLLSFSVATTACADSR